MPLGCCKQQFAFADSCRGIDAKGKSVKFTNMFTINEHLIFRIYLHRKQTVILAALAHQHRCASIDETLAERAVQSVRQLFLQSA